MSKTKSLPDDDIVRAAPTDPGDRLAELESKYGPYTKRWNVGHPVHGGRLIKADSEEEALAKYRKTKNIPAQIGDDKLKEQGLLILETPFTSADTEVGKFPRGFLSDDALKRYHADQLDIVRAQRPLTGKGQPR